MFARRHYLKNGPVKALSLDATVAAALEGVPPALASPGSLALISGVLGQLPDAVSHHFRLECGLNEGAQVPDFVLKIPAGSGCKILAGLNENITIPSELMTRPAWRQARRFCLNWANAGSPLHRRVQGLWLEFDRASRPGSNLLHKVFFFLDDSSGEESSEGKGKDDHEWIAETAIPLLSGAREVDAVLENLLLCLSKAQGVAQILQVGLTQSRVPNAVKLGLYLRSRRDLLAYLESIGWQGRVDGFESLVRPLYDSRPAGQVCLNVNIGPVVSSKISLEYHFNGFLAEDREAAWSAITRQLVASGFCTSEKRKALLAFPGYSIQNVFYERVFFRSLTHVKLSCMPGLPVEARAVIGITVRPLADVRSARKAGT